jgi:hypothetical protein
MLLQHRHYSFLNALHQGLSIFDFRFQRTCAKQRDGILSHSVLRYFPSLAAVDKLAVSLMQKYAQWLWRGCSSANIWLGKQLWFFPVPAPEKL